MSALFSRVRKSPIVSLVVNFIGLYLLTLLVLLAILAAFFFGSQGA